MMTMDLTNERGVGLCKLSFGSADPNMCSKLTMMMMMIRLLELSFENTDLWFHTGPTGCGL